VNALSPKVTLVTNEVAESNGESSMVRSNLFEGDIAYLRIRRVSDGLDQQIRQACQPSAGITSSKAGLDLRYSSGDDYLAAAAAADLFVRKEQTLLFWERSRAIEGEKDASPFLLQYWSTTNCGSARSACGVDAPNRRRIDLGGMTAGRAMIAQEFPLKNGERLRIATSPIVMGDGSSVSSHASSQILP